MFGNNVSDANNDVLADNSDLLDLVKNNRAGLKTLRDDHLDILSEIRNEEQNRRNSSWWPGGCKTFINESALPKYLILVTGGGGNFFQVRGIFLTVITKSTHKRSSSTPV